MRKIAIVLALTLSGCSAAQVQKFQTASTNFQTVVASINADIAAVAPLVAADCADLQKWAMLLAPLVPQNGKAPQYFSAANAALNAYCQKIPTDIASTASAVFAAVTAAQQGYDSVSTGAK